MSALTAVKIVNFRQDISGLMPFAGGICGA
jgi:hypothetical protein